MADETQTVMAPPEILGAPYDDGGGRASPPLHHPFNRGRGGLRRRTHPLLGQDLLLAHDAIIDLPVVEVERTRDEGG